MSILDKIGYTSFDLNKGTYDLRRIVYIEDSNTEKPIIVLGHRNYPVIMVKDRERSTYKHVVLPKDFKYPSFGNTKTIDIVKDIVYVKIKSNTESVKLFGLRKVKNSMLESGKLFEIANLLERHKCKIDGEVRDIIEVVSLEDNKRNIKFVIDDLEFIYPPVNDPIKGYTPKKDRRISIGKLVRVVKKNKQGIPVKSTGVVIHKSRVANNEYGNAEYCHIKSSINDKIYNIKTNKLKVI